MPTDPVAQLATGQPDADGTSVPAGVRVFRLMKEPRYESLNDEARQRLLAGEALPDFFVLSADDRNHVPSRLSVWLEPLTTVGQAWVIRGSLEAVRITLFLAVDRIRSIRPGGVPDGPWLEVVWERATREENGQRVPDDRVGSLGHCGIEGLDRGTKQQRQFVRMKLGELAAVQLFDPTATGQTLG